MDHNRPEILRSFRHSRSCSCLAEIGFSHPPDHDHPQLLIPQPSTPYFHEKLPCEETRDGVLLQYYRFQDNFYSHLGQLPSSSTLANDQEGRSSCHAIEELLTGISELYEKLSKKIRSKLGLNKNSERVVNFTVPTTRTRGLNIRWSWTSTVHQLGVRHRHDQHHCGKLERFKIRTLNVLVEGDVKEPQK
ncbi:hypothetical protein TIFTF001_008597 [Ficus carica]|uniref:Uncharacterized protein n=1 Tax=Ficus carica TaxID=3494 RepID=A0AA87ZTB2_FICCA|nr:hypothetical protein TIFTF001_008597 [Ficus carica]